MKTPNCLHQQLIWAFAYKYNPTRAGRNLDLAPQTVSSQIRDFETMLGEKLFLRAGRCMPPTHICRVALLYADEIFLPGQEFRKTLRGQPTGHPLRLMVDLADPLPLQLTLRSIMPLTEGTDLTRMSWHGRAPGLPAFPVS